VHDAYGFCVFCEKTAGINTSSDSAACDSGKPELVGNSPEKGNPRDRLAIVRRRLVGSIQWAELCTLAAIENRDTFADEQHLVGPGGERPVAARTAVVVEVQVGDVEEPLQLSHRINVARLVDAMKLDRKLIDVFEDRIRSFKEGVPLSSFYIDLHDQMTARISVLPELMLRGLEPATGAVG